MENQNNEIKLNDSAISFLRESAKWSMFLAILGFIGIGFMLLFGIFFGAVMSKLPMNNGMSSNPFAMMPGVMTAVYVILALMYFFPVYYLYKYAQNTKIALQNADSDLLADGLGYLKSHHKFLGVMMIVIMSLYVLIIIGAIIFGIAAATT